MFQLKSAPSERGLRDSSSASRYVGPTFQLNALVVDDNPLNRRILRKSLENLGLETTEAKDGQEAVDLSFSTDAFHVIFMDRDMPIMDGLQATRILRSKGVHAKIVGVSSHCMPEDIEEFMGAGLDAFRAKPIDNEKLVSVIQELNLG